MVVWKCVKFQYMEACEGCNDFIQCRHLSVAHIHTYILYVTVRCIVSHPLSSFYSPSHCMCVFSAANLLSTEHTAQKKKIPQYSHTLLSFSRFIPHSALLCSSSLPFSLPHCCFPPSATPPSPSPLSLLFLTTHSFQSCLCPQDSFFLSISVSLSYSPLSFI